LWVAAVAGNGIAAGATLDQAVKQLPARRRIGPTAYLGYVRAADLRNGLIWYPIMGIGAAVLTVAAVIAVFLVQPVGVPALAAGCAGLCTLAHAGATARAAPLLLTLRRGAHSEDSVVSVLDRFAVINSVRAVGIVLTLAAAIWALVIVM
jgi:hypothetical protein